MISYLANVTLRLAAGVGKLPEQMRLRHGAYLAAAQRDDGGFAGRQGPSDLYYTSFGLRGLVMLDQFSDSAAQRAAEFLQHSLEHQLPSIDFLSLVISAVLLETATGIDVFAAAGLARRQAVIDFFEPFRRDDGGYAKTERGGQSSTYHTFLVLLCKQLIGAPLDDTQRMVALLHSRRRSDGGFVEVAPVQPSGTNPTAAALGLLQILGAVDDATRTSATAFLSGMQAPEGGLRANAQIPAADLLSTFSGLVALDTLGGAAHIDRAAAGRFVRSLQRTEGGFRAGAWDAAADVEYTFYGLAALALLAAAEG